MRCHGLLPCRKRRRRRRRSLLRNHLPARDCRRRGGDVTRGGSLRSHYGRPRGSHRNSRGYRRRGKLLWRHPDRSPGYRLGACKSGLRNRRHCTLHVPICISDIRDGRGLVNDGCVIDVGDLGDVHGRAADVDALHIAAAYWIRRHINFTRTKREPSYISAPSASPADKDHQGGRIYGSLFSRTSDPAPSAAHAYPASVVERGVAPWRVIDPCVSPGIDPCPMAFVVGRPVPSYMRKPDMAVVAFIAPVAIVVEVVVSHHILGEILCRARVIPAIIAAVCPGVEPIGLSDLLDVGVERVGSAKGSALSGVHVIGLPITCGLALAFVNGDNSIAAVFA